MKFFVMSRTVKLALGLLVVLGVVALAWKFLYRPETGTASGVRDVSPEDLADILASGRPGILEFYTSSCPYCRMMGPVLEQIQTDYGDRVFVAMMNAEKYPSEAAKYRIPGVPTMILFEASGKVKTAVVGYRGYDETIETLREVGLID